MRTPAILLLMTVATLTGCPAERVAPAAKGRPSLLLVTLDTTRADRLGCYGSSTGATPHLDRLAAEGVLVQSAASVAPLTLPSHASILTGQYPPTHGVRDNADFRLPDEATTLAEHMRAHGYATAASVGAYVLSSVFGLSQGFDAYEEPRQPADRAAGGAEVRFRAMLERRASEVTDAALSAIDGRLQAPFFLWVHYFDPHQRYDPPAPWRQRFAGSPYDGEIAYMDEQIGRLLEGLETRGRLRNTLVAVVADHGEGLGEHGEATHGLFLYEATVRVPMILHWPEGLPPGIRLREAASGPDLAPTLLELMGVSPLPGAQGKSFAGAAKGGAERRRDPSYAEALYSQRAYGWSPLFALRDARTKFIEAPDPELFHLEEDAAEGRNLAAASAGEVERWRERLERTVQRFAPASDEAQRALDDEQRARLASLGYLSGTGTRRDAPQVDPKDRVGLHNAVVEAQDRLSHGDLSGARSRLEDVLHADPANPAASALHGMLLFSGGGQTQGLAQLEAAGRARPDVYEIQHNLGNALHLVGRYADAARAYGAAAQLRPRSPEDRMGLGHALVAAGDAAGAARAYREAIGLGLTVPAAHAALGVALARTGDAMGAETELTQAVELDPRLAAAWNQLGILAEKEGRLPVARERYERALAAEPDSSDALFNEAKVCLRLGDTASALRSARRLVETNPDYPAGRFLLGQALLASGDTEGARSALKAFLGQRNADARLSTSAREILARMGS